MDARVAIVTGGLSGLGRAMALGLAGAGHKVIAAGHLRHDADAMAAEAATTTFADRLVPMLADLRKPVDCDRTVAAALDRFGRVDILVNSAGLTFTYIWPDLYRRPARPRFWEASDKVVQAVMETNYIAADQMARRVALRMVNQGWGRIINVTTRLDTMNRAGTCPYGASKAALEMATEVWAKEVAATGLTVNILNPGAGANTPGMAEEMRQANREGRVARLLEPEEMVAPLLWLVSPEADQVNGYRFDANLWDSTIAPAEAARQAGRPAGFILHPAA
jgi:NAD(P)-dependent dehydrogenase (short-subunit alcohol dehydrogenase family)